MNENLKITIAICITIITCMAAICISVTYENKMKKEILIKCLDVKAFDCKG